MSDFLSADYWEERYKLHDTGWDMGEVSPPLKAYFDQLTNKDVAILIPGCGNSYEAEYLVQQGFTNVTVIDIAEGPVERLNAVLGEEGRKCCRVIHADFFKHEGQYDIVVEQTFFCALDPQLRKQYVEHMFTLLKPGGKIAGVMFKTHFEKPGPPFGGTQEEYIALFKDKFFVHTMAGCYNSHEKRLGNEIFVIFKKLS
ncbi:MAG TPA: methyltransferase domain-containing protein [Chitinophagales bacterium]|nr:methyltransferase domain-containing protein [Chitinophagales bacterium]HRG28732.1 methyltransferase domain-containing protein [Chitinophagales bacterium]HRH54536.1 methyltransferase domain-containing protein [Chitinophagales bacterium]